MTHSNSRNEYDDEYPSCRRTKVKLRIYHDTLSPKEITAKLGILPERTQEAGAISPETKYAAKISGWFLDSEGHVESKDSRRHLDWLLDRVESKTRELKQLCDAGCRIDICCVWNSKQGHGGPTLSVPQFKRLAELGIELWFDIYPPIA